MKPANFPARKEARRIAALNRSSGNVLLPHRAYEVIELEPYLLSTRDVRTKKRRAS